MAKVSSDIHTLVKEFCRGGVNESEFISRLEKIKEKHNNPSNIARSISNCLTKLNASDSNKSDVWRLAQSVDPSIDPEEDDWFDASNWDMD